MLFRSVVTAAVNINSSADGVFRLLSSGGQSLISQSGSGTIGSLVPGAGDNCLEVEGTSGNGWRGYGYGLSFCPLPDDPIVATVGRSEVCTGEVVTLTATPGYDSYAWYRDGSRIDGTGSQLAVGTAGIYTVQGAKCGLTRSSTSSLRVTTNPLPDAPTISPDPARQRLVSSAATGNQWYLNGSPIAGATSPVLPYAQLGSGWISLRVTSAKGCSSTSAPFVVTANEPVPEPGLQVSPNPASGRVVIMTPVAPPYALRLTNLTGQTLWSKEVNTREREHGLDVSTWPAGLYLLRLESGTNSETVKVLVQ